MSAGGGFPIDIVLFGMIAAFLVLRLRSVLGRRQGFERPAEPVAPPAPVARAAAQPGPVIDVAPPRPTHALPEPGSQAGQALARIRETDPGFDPGHFLDGARAAFGMIVTAFAAGDRAALRPLLADDTYAAFTAAIAAREAAGETQRTEIRAIPAVTIEAAELRGDTASITVRFVSDQVNITLARDGSPVHGTDAVTEITDLWTFERMLGNPDPTWRLVAARSA